MPFVQETRKVFKGMGIIAFGVIFSLYFGYHLLNGKRGVSAYSDIKKEVANLQLISDQLDQQKRVMENKIAGLSNSTIDLDLLEESARTVLAMAHKDEYIIYR